MLDVLLISPRLPSGDPRRCGDHTYTDLMLQYPPQGVRYHHYEDLIAAGRAHRIRSLHTLSYYLNRAGILPPDMWLETVATDFVPDIVHVYGFSAVVRLPRNAGKPPIILGAGTGSYSDLKYYHGWSESAILRARRLKRHYLRAIGAYDSSLCPEHAAHVLTWSDFSRSMHLDEGFVRDEQISVLYPGLPSPETMLKSFSERNLLTFLFVGSSFERKNGDLVLEAFRTVHRIYPQTQLLLVGRPSDRRIIREPGVQHHHFVAHEILCSNFYAQADVLLAPSQAEGFGLVILEAMAHGLCIITANAWALPEMVQNGRNGFLVNTHSLDALTNCMLHVAQNPEVLREMRTVSRASFEEKFSIPIHNAQLHSIYAKFAASSVATILH